MHARFMHPSTPFDHSISLTPSEYNELLCGTRMHLILRSENGYSKGQFMRIRSYNHTEGRHTGETLYARITSVSHEGNSELTPSLYVLSVRVTGVVDNTKFPDGIPYRTPPTLKHTQVKREEA